MTGRNQSNIVTCILDRAYCTFCRCYLSFAPIWVLPNGKSFCNDCSLSSVKPQCYRNLYLEDVLSTLPFPCKYRYHGCEEFELPFGSTKQHEAKCDFRTFACPSVLNGDVCTWQGSVVEISDHFNKYHMSCVKEKMKFKLALNRDRQEILFSTIDNVACIMKYVYNADTSELRYDLRYMVLDVLETTCKICLTNDWDDDYRCYIPIKECLPYHDNFYVEQNMDVLILNNYLKVLNNPACIAVMVKVSVTEEASIKVKSARNVD